LALPIGVGPATYQHQLKKLPTPWPWWPNLPAFNGQEPIKTRAKYLVLRQNQTRVEKHAVLASELKSYRIYRLTDGSSYASLVTDGPSSDSQNRPEGAREVDATALDLTSDDRVIRGEYSSEAFDLLATGASRAKAGSTPAGVIRKAVTAIGSLLLQWAHGEWLRATRR
jgi:hypothetical protein